MIYIAPGASDVDKPSALFDNLFIQGAVTGGSAPDGPVTNAITGSTWDYWYPNVSSTSAISVSLPNQRYADAAFIDAHNLGTSGGQVRVQRSTDNGGSWTTIYDWVSTLDNNPLMFLFPGGNGNAYRIEHRNATNSAIGVVMIGKRLIFPFGVDDRYTSFPHARRIDVMGGNSLGGQFLGQKIIRRGGNNSITFPLLDAQWVDVDMYPFESHYNTGKPFAFATKPSFRANDLAYCWRPDRASELRPTYSEGGLYEDFTMEVDFFNG